MAVVHFVYNSFTLAQESRRIRVCRAYALLILSLTARAKTNVCFAAASLHHQLKNPAAFAPAVLTHSRFFRYRRMHKSKYSLRSCFHVLTQESRPIRVCRAYALLILSLTARAKTNVCFAAACFSSSLLDYILFQVSLA